MIEYGGFFLKTLHQFKIERCVEVIETGFEPVTVCLEGRCSIQLSYSTDILSVNLKKTEGKCNYFEIIFKTLVGKTAIYFLGFQKKRS